jgi:hypothetical protein
MRWNRRGPAISVALCLFLGACGGSEPSGSDWDQARFKRAGAFRVNIVRETGQRHLSLSDYSAMADVVCDGAANSTDSLVTLAQVWGLGLSSSDETGAGAIVIAAGVGCPEAIVPPVAQFDLVTTRAPTSGSATTIGLPSQFVDLNIIEPADWESIGGTQAALFARSTLNLPVSVEHFRTAFSSDWTVHETVGPLIDGAVTSWSIDISSQDFSGVVDVYDTTDPALRPDGQPGVRISIVIVPRVYPLPTN